MLHKPKIADYLKILTDEDVKDFVVINIGKCFEKKKKKKISAKLLNCFILFLTTPAQVEIYVKLIENLRV